MIEFVAQSRNKDREDRLSYLARDLRRRQTPAERVMWRLLRDRRLRGELRLVLELDGEIHEKAQPAARDRERDAYIRGLGFTILRFPNERVFSDTEGVISEILAFARRKTWI